MPENPTQRRRTLVFYGELDTICCEAGDGILDRRAAEFCIEGSRYHDDCARRQFEIGDIGCFCMHGGDFGDGTDVVLQAHLRK